MFIPETISKNTLSTYTPIFNNKRNKQILNAHDFYMWHENVPTRLNILCLKCLASNWTVNPIMDELILEEDRRMLIDFLPTTLPHELAISVINDDVYWKRCFKQRWPNRVPSVKTYKNADQTDVNEKRGADSASSVHNFSTWKRNFIEMFLQDLLENLKPEDYNPEQMQILIDLFNEYVYKLKLNQIQAPQLRSRNNNRISLEAILSGLYNLVELSVCFKQSYVGEAFTWRVMETTMDDINNFAKGLQNTNLLSLSVINSDITCDKADIILKGLVTNKELMKIDFSHCKIGKNGIKSIADILLEIPSLDELVLQNNLIGPDGIEVLFIAIRQRGLKKLDLGLNKLGTEGCEILARNLMVESCYLEILGLAGCGLSKNSLFCEMLEVNVGLKDLDLSNNKLGAEMGTMLLDSLQSNRFLERLDIRMCGITPQTFHAIQSILSQCRRERRRNKC